MNIVNYVVLLIICFVMHSCNNVYTPMYKVDVQGHRGARAVYPENTIEGFIYALETGATTLEMDVAITKDSQVILSHEPWISAEICFDSTGQEIDEKKQKLYNIFQMHYNDVARFDCGSKLHPRFPNQKKIAIYKPLLSAVIDTIEKKIAARNLPKVYYNIETKCLPEGDNIYHPAPEIFSELIMRIILEKKIVERTFVQSFDVRTLQYLHQKYPEIKTVLLVENQHTPEKNLEWLGYTPYAYSPNYSLVNEVLRKFCDKNNMQLIPWTVNKKEDIESMLKYRVDGIISDDPALVINVLKQKNIKTIFQK